MHGYNRPPPHSELRREGGKSLSQRSSRSPILKSHLYWTVINCKADATGCTVWCDWRLLIWLQFNTEGGRLQRNYLLPVKLMLRSKKVIGVVAVFCLILASTHQALRRKYFLSSFQRVIGVSTLLIWVQFNSRRNLDSIQHRVPGAESEFNSKHRAAEAEKQYSGCGAPSLFLVSCQAFAKGAVSSSE